MKSMPCVERPDFDRAQNIATDLLLQQSFESLHIDVRNFVFDRKITIDSVQHFSNVVNRPLSSFTCNLFSGCCLLKYARCNVILYDDLETNEERKHWGIAHEIGHIYLDHDNDGPVQEIEAHFFAAQVVTPEILLIEISKMQGKLDIFDLYDSFNVSLKSAEKRISTMNRRMCWNSSTRDKELLNKFKPILKSEFSFSKHSSQLQVHA